MTADNGDDGGERLPADATSRPTRGADTTNRSEDTDEGVAEGIDEAAESFRSDQWKTYIVATTIGLVVASVLVGTIVYQAFLNRDSLLNRGPSYPDSPEGAQAYLRETVVPQLEMKYSRADGPSFACERTEVVAATGASNPSVFETTVRCESPDRTLEIDVEILHGKHSMDRNTRIQKSKEK